LLKVIASTLKVIDAIRVVILNKEKEEKKNERRIHLSLIKERKGVRSKR
jgi:hypothetical protein